MLIHALAGQLRPREQRILSGNPWSISAIVLWELAKLSQLERIVLDLDDADTSRVLGALHVWPIDWAVARESTRLDFRGDPANELIAATSVVHNVPLLTRDRAMLRSRLVPLAAR